MRTAIPVTLFLSLLTTAALAADPDFNRDIRPILSKNCFACHGPDDHSRQANLRLDSHEAATGATGGHIGIVPGDSANSRIVIRITHPAMPMPPVGERLSPEEIDLIKRWIDAGAPYESHWAFEAPVRSPLPEVRDDAWLRNEIDHFVLARLEAEGLTPAPEADRYTLARRVSLDLIGLPPSPEQVDAFVNDDEPGAYERYVNRLFNSPRYGERWAAVWLDLARYADSKGYEADRLRTIWPYRDWVIRALNANMPYDRFTLLQLAGDLLPVPTRDQLIATGFHRNTMTNDEGGTDNEEFRDAAVKDRIATTGQVWMGITVGCAQCHNHKYDPISQREFYQLYAFFNQTADADRVDERPRLDLGGGVSTLIMQELPPGEQRETHIHNRGNFLDPGEPVKPAVPAALQPMPQGAPANRLGLAKWLTDKSNPLTARVAVNRYWARFFGAGLVETEEDFGNQGSPPTHPLLLDWLATEFMRLDWDMKAIKKKIVMSATYRQASHVAPELLERDPNNRLLARGPRVRLDAEMVRDQTLAAAGLLSDKMYGPPVMPLQPEKVWNTPYNRDRWETSEGEDRYRRAIYTLWRRTTPYPSLATFDAPSGEICTLRRIRTNTPLQALATLNDPLGIEAAESLAGRVLREAGESFDERAVHAFRICLARPPEPGEIERLRRLYDDSIRGLDEPAARDLLNASRIIYPSDRTVTIIPNSNEEPGEWRYTAEAPPEGWTSPRFDHSSWSIGRGMFGRIEKKKKDKKDEDRDDDELVDKNEYKRPEIRTAWAEDAIWLRREFHSGRGFDSFKIWIEYRGSFEVWINEVPAAESGIDISGPVELDISPEAQAAIRPDRNVIAVAAKRTVEGDGDQYVDIGLTALRPPDFAPRRPGDQERAAWTVVAHVLLNLDEALTRR